MSREAARSCRSPVAKKTDRPLETLSVQLASAHLSMLKELQQKVNEACVAEQMSWEVGEELKQMIVAASVLPLAVVESAKKQHAGRRRGGRERWARSKEEAGVKAKKERAARLKKAADAIRLVHAYDRSEHHTKWLAEQLAPRFNTTPQSMRKELNALKIP